MVWIELDVLWFNLIAHFESCRFIVDRIDTLVYIFEDGSSQTITKELLLSSLDVGVYCTFYLSDWSRVWFCWSWSTFCTTLIHVVCTWVGLLWKWFTASCHTLLIRAISWVYHSYGVVMMTEKLNYLPIPSWFGMLLKFVMECTIASFLSTFVGRLWLCLAINLETSSLLNRWSWIWCRRWLERKAWWLLLWFFLFLLSRFRK